MPARAGAEPGPALSPASPVGIRYWQEALAQPHATGELLLRYDPLRSQSQAVARPAALTAAEHIESMPDLGLERYRVQGNLAETLAVLNADPAIDFAEPNYLLTPDFEPNDPYYIDYAANDSLLSGGYLNRLHMAAAWDIARGSPDIVVAIIDTGVDLDHEDIREALWRNPGEIPANGQDDDGNSLIDDVFGWDFAAERPNVDDWYGHGSHVAGIVAARFHNGVGIAGMAPKARVMALGVFAPPGYGTFADEIEAILYATDKGARVINLSLGSTAYSRGEQMAVEYATRHGVVVAAAAGNDGREIYHWPSAHQAAIAVAATTAKDARASFSNMGAYVDVAAPGVAIWSLRMGGDYRTLSGTSMATPHVAGLAALILGRNPALTPAEVRAIIETTATDLGAPGWDKSFGFGRIDALAALQATAPYTGVIPPLTPDWLRLQTWPPLCNELVQDGDFEAPVQTSWTLTGTAAVTATIAISGAHSLQLVGQPNGQGVASQLLTIPPDLHAATLYFGIRVDNDDRDFGVDPTWPGRDHLSVWLRTADGAPLLELMRAGNANFNLSAGLPWDRYLHILADDELALLRQAGQVQLWFYADNGADPTRTRFYIDDVRFCAAHAPAYLPLLMR